MARKQLADVTDRELRGAARIVRRYLRRDERIDEATAKRAGKLMARYVTQEERRVREEARRVGVGLVSSSAMNLLRTPGRKCRRNERRRFP